MEAIRRQAVRTVRYLAAEASIQGSENMTESQSFNALHDRESVSVAAQVSCVYCRADISSASFDFVPPTRRVVSAICPRCRRAVTMLATSWRRETARTLHIQG